MRFSSRTELSLSRTLEQKIADAQADTAPEGEEQTRTQRRRLLWVLHCWQRSEAGGAVACTVTQFLKAEVTRQADVTRTTAAD